MSTPDLCRIYHQLSRSAGLLSNPSQLKVLERLQCYLNRAPAPKKAALTPLFNLVRSMGRKSAGAYLYGEVGCGKTMLMDLFYDAYPSTGSEKLRVHFNQFMLRIHERSHQLRIEKSSKILQSIAEELRGQYRLLCLDEFQVVDIADAMILRGLLDALFRANITLMVTSNRPPSDLYLNGIQRASFVPCIELIQRRLEVMEVQAQQDYRLLSTGVDGAMPYYFQDKCALERLFEGRYQHKTSPCTVDVLGRSLFIERAAGNQAWFHFDELFRRNLSAVDYLALSSRFAELYICDIPQFTWEMRAEARRFVVFLDIIYDLRKRLAMHSTVPISGLFQLEGRHEVNSELLDELQASASSSLFTGAEERFAAARAISRLRQLTSQSWWDQKINE